MGLSSSTIQGNFKQRYGRWIDPLPDLHTLADAGNFVPQEQRPGLGYNFPVLTQWEHGQTADNTGTAFTINPDVPAQVLNATLDGSTILLQAVASYDEIFASLNGAGPGNSGGAFKTTLDLKIEAMMKGAGMYRELALAYGPGSATALASNIGVVGGTVSGANLAAPQVVFFTQASWIPGLWAGPGAGMKIDVYQADGTTVRETGVFVQAIPSTTNTRLTLFKTGSSATVAATDVIVPFGWRTKSCYGLEAIYNNATTLFGINAATVRPWRCNTFATTGTLTRQKIAQYASQIALTGVTNGGKLYVVSFAFADLANELDVNQRWIGNTEDAKRTGTNSIEYATAAGTIEVVVYQYAKISEAFFVANDNFRRVGSTDITMRPIGGGAEGFFTQLTDKSGAQVKTFSNQAPVFEMPYRNFMITGIQPTFMPTAA